MAPAPTARTYPLWGGLVCRDPRRLSWGELVASPPILTTSEVSLAQLASIRRPRPSLLLLLLFVSASIPASSPTDISPTGIIISHCELTYLDLGACFFLAWPLPKTAAAAARLLRPLQPRTGPIRPSPGLPLAMALLLLPPRTGPVRPSPGLRLPMALLLLQLLELVQLLLKLVNLLGLFLQLLLQVADDAVLPKK